MADITIRVRLTRHLVIEEELLVPVTLDASKELPSKNLIAEQAVRNMLDEEIANTGQSLDIGHKREYSEGYRVLGAYNDLTPGACRDRFEVLPAEQE